MAKLRVEKVVATLPDPLVANTIYLVRTGAGFTLHVTDATGSVTYTANTAYDGAIAEIAALEPEEKDFLQYVGGEWQVRTVDQVIADFKKQIQRISKRSAILFG